MTVEDLSGVAGQPAQRLARAPAFEVGVAQGLDGRFHELLKDRFEDDLAGRK